MRIKATWISKTMVVAIAMVLMAGCVADGVLAPAMQPGLREKPSVAHNYVTDQGLYLVTAYVGMGDGPYNQHNQGEDWEYEFRFASSGWSVAHMEPRHMWHMSEWIPSPMYNLEHFRASPRIGTDDHINLRFCFRSSAYGVYKGCYGQMYVRNGLQQVYLDSLTFGPEDSGVEKVVYTTGDVVEMRGEAVFRIRLDWTPVNVQVASVEVGGLLSIPAGSAHEYFGVARDANGASIPGLPISWTSSDTRHATLFSSGVAVAREPGTVGIVATIGGVSGTRMVEVNNDLGVIVSGETSPKTGQACRYYAEMNSSSSGNLTYEWREGWDSESAVLGTGSYFDRQFSPYESTRLMLRVRDGGGREGWAYLDVSADQASGNDCGR